MGPPPIRRFFRLVPTYHPGALSQSTAMPLVLASASPRRRELVGRLGVPFEIVAADLNETPLQRERGLDLAVRLSRLKAEAVAVARPGVVVLGADTVVVRGRRLFGKPIDAADAIAMLLELAGRGHRVITGVTVVGPHGTASAATTSRVWLASWNADKIAAYVRSGDSLDKAGSYAIQNAEFRPVDRISGCRCNVIGLPLAVVSRMLGVNGRPRCDEYQRRRCEGQLPASAQQGETLNARPPQHGAHRPRC